MDREQVLLKYFCPKLGIEIIYPANDEELAALPEPTEPLVSE